MSKHIESAGMIVNGRVTFLVLEGKPMLPPVEYTSNGDLPENTLSAEDAATWEE